MDYRPFTPFSDANIDGHMLFGMTGRQCQTTICNGKIEPLPCKNAPMCHSRESR